ncbi:MAG: hypothetical protein U0S48_22520 [Solirubrobacteraceae bacterium]
MPDETAGSDEFSDPAIPRRVWEHLTAWSKSMGQTAQIIVVGNRPPHVADSEVIVRFSGRADEPPTVSTTTRLAKRQVYGTEFVSATGWMRHVGQGAASTLAQAMRMPWSTRARRGVVLEASRTGHGGAGAGQ